MNNKIRKLSYTRTKEDETIETKFYPKGSLIVRGTKCPKCGQFFACAANLHICSNCGYKKKRIKPHEQKKYLKALRRKKYEEKQQKAS